MIEQGGGEPISSLFLSGGVVVYKGEENRERRRHSAGKFRYLRRKKNGEGEKKGNFRHFSPPARTGFNKNIFCRIDNFGARYKTG